MYLTVNFTYLFKKKIYTMIFTSNGQFYLFLEKENSGYN